MSKRILLPLLIVALALGLSAPAMASRTAGWTFDIQVQVEPWIEKNPDLPHVLKMQSLAQGETEVLDEGIGDGFYEAFYSNVPFTKTYEGNNAADDRLPIFARHEREKDGTEKLDRFDRLSTQIFFRTSVNFPGRKEDLPNMEHHTIIFGCLTQDGPGTPLAAFPAGYWKGGQNSSTFGTPHDGEVWERFSVVADRKLPDYGTNNQWYESADAGIYELTIIETLQALDTLQSADAFVPHP